MGAAIDATGRFKPNFDKSRLDIPTQKILQRFALNTLGELKPPMTPSQIRTGEILLKKALPDLASVTVEDKNGNAQPVIFNITK